MEKTNEIGPFNKSPEASMKRFEARQKHKESTEGKVIAAARDAEDQEEGDIVNKENKVLGKHQGLHFYTIGQRKGINLPNGPWWVSGINKKKNELIVTNKENDPALFSKKIIVSDYHFISGKIPKKTIKVMAKIRFNQKVSSANLRIRNKNILELIFNKPQKAVTPGQWAVFYSPRRSKAKEGQKNVCLGGGIIK